PALVRNYVDSHADGQRRVYYALTPAGWAWLEAGDEPTADDLEGKLNHRIEKLYYDRLRIASARLDVADPPDSKELGCIPLPNAIEDLKLSTTWAPFSAC